jgi:hypothetical protein
MDKKDWYYLQSVTEAEMDSAFDQVEAADRAIVKTNSLVGLTSSNIVPTPVGAALSITVPPFTAFDKLGRRIPSAAPITQLLTTATGGGSTAPSSGNRRWISVFARFGYALSDARTDGFSATIQFQKTETLSEDGTNAGAGKFYITVGAQDLVTNPPPAKPTLDSEAILICDVLRSDGETEFTIQDIDTSRQELSIIEQLKTPTAIPTAWTTPVRIYRNAARHNVSGVDHLGYPAGLHLRFVENWLDVTAAAHTLTTASAPWFGRWNYAINNGGGGIAGAVYANGAWTTDATTHPQGAISSVYAYGQAVDASAVIEAAHPIWRMSNGSLVFETSFSLNDSGGGTGTLLSHSSWALGIGSGNWASTNSALPINNGAAVTFGVYLCRDPNDNPNRYRMIIRTVGGFSAGFVTSIAPAADQPHRYRIELMEAGESDDGQARILQYIDGALQWNIVASTAGMVISPFFRSSANQGEGLVLNVGQTRVLARTNDLNLI